MIRRKDLADWFHWPDQWWEEVQHPVCLLLRKTRLRRRRRNTKRRLRRKRFAVEEEEVEPRLK